MIKAKAYAAQSASTPMAPFDIERRDPGPDDVQIQILYCGVCHSDLHTARNEWKNTMYPSVPGHEIVGRVIAVGSRVKKFKAGDIAGVGCLIDSCGHCPSCGDGLEQYCENGFVGTYNGPAFGGDNTYGGYSQTIVVKESFVLQDRDTTRSSSRRWRRCSAPESRPTRRCATGTPARARPSASSASAASATWA